MRLSEQVNALLWSWSETLRALRRRAALGPLLVYAAAQTAALLALAFFAYPPLSAVVAPALKWRFGERALHYPNNLFVLRPALGEVDVPLSVLFGSLTAGAAAIAFAAFYHGRRERFAASWRAASPCYLPLVGAAAITTALSQVISRVPLSFWGHLAEDSPSRFRLLRLVTIALVIAVQALMVYAIPAIAAGKRRFGPAVLGSLRLAVRQPVVTYLIVAAPAALELFPAWLARESDVIAIRFSPELLIGVMLIWIAVILLASYATLGAATRLFVHSTDDGVTDTAPSKEA